MSDIPNSCRIEPGVGGLPRIAISSALATAHIYLHGAHVTHYQRVGEPPLLFMSDASIFQENKPIRGGVPICFPWFGPRANRPDSPGHGFARLLPWKQVDIRESPDGDVVVELALQDSDVTRAHWPHAFELRYVVTVGRKLNLALTVRNSGSQPFTFEEALHTYFSVADIRKVSVTGLERTRCFSKVNNEGLRTSGPEPITFVGETDRVYLGTQATCVIHDPGLGRDITVAKSGSDATVVWNPWIAKAKAMPDFGDQEWPVMVCVETANAMEGALTLEPGQSHTMAQDVA